MKKPLADAELHELVTGLNKLARNLWWTWNQEAQEIFQELSPARLAESLPQRRGHPARSLRLRAARAAAGPGFCAARARRCSRSFEAYMTRQSTPGPMSTRRRCSRIPVAYFSAEFGFHETLPIAAGGLGILAGDHAKSASDLGLGFVGISLFYREGYFQQAIDANNWQTEYYTLLNPKNLPAGTGARTRRASRWCCRRGHRHEPGCLPGLAGERRPGAGLSAGRQPPRKRAAFPRPDPAGLWRRQHDADHAGNAAGHRRRPPAARAGRAAVGLPHERRARGLPDAGTDPGEDGGRARTSPDAMAATQAECIFTTHTPVEAGHDRFSPDLMDYAMHRFRRQLPVAVRGADEAWAG